MTRKPKKTFQRPQAIALAARLAEPRRFIQVVAGPRQVGKTTLVQQITEGLPFPVRQSSADEPTLRGTDWIPSNGRQHGYPSKALTGPCWYWTRSRKSPVGRKR